MTILRILELPDPRLRQVAVAVERFDDDLRRQVDDLLETLYSTRAIGLAATQVNLHRQIIVMDVSETRDAPQVFVNPRALRLRTLAMVEESCLSVPGVSASVRRCIHLDLAAQDATGAAFERAVEGLEAVCLQHEMDHLQGRLFSDALPFLQRLRWRRQLREPARRVRRGDAA